MTHTHYLCLMICGLACASSATPAATSTAAPPAATAETLLTQAEQHTAAGETQEALDCYLRAAESGQAEAQYRLALMYRDGEGAEKDYEAYCMWLNKAAESGYVDAQFELAAHYQMGGSFNETPQEEEARHQLAAEWYRRAARRCSVDYGCLLLLWNGRAGVCC